MTKKRDQVPANDQAKTALPAGPMSDLGQDAASTPTGFPVNALANTNGLRPERRFLGKAMLALLVLTPLAGAMVWFGAPEERPELAALAQTMKAAGENGIAQLKSGFISRSPIDEAVLPVRGVRVMRVSIARLVEERSFTGIVAARYEAQLSFRVGGKIALRNVEVGTQIVAGTKLFELDPADYQIALRAANADLAAAKAQQFQANADEKRQGVLLKQGWTTQAAYDRFLAGSNAANDRVAAANEGVKRAANQLSYSTLSAPESAIVTSISAEAGQVVAAGQPVLTIARTGEREAIVSVPEGQMDGLKDWKAEASFWSQSQSSASVDHTNQSLSAQLREIAPQADPASRTFRARFSIETGAVVPALGSTVTIKLSRTSGDAVAVIPASAVAFKNGKPVVWVVNQSKDRAAPREVYLVELSSETARIKGLSSGDQIVTLGIHRLDPALPIRVIEEMNVVAGGGDSSS